MKVLMLFNDYLQPGGERVSVATEVDALRAAGVNVRVLQVANDNLQESGPVGKMSATFPRREAFKTVSREIAEFRPDLVHAQNLFPQLGAGAVRAIGESGTPWIRTLRNYRKGCIAGTFSRDGAPCHDCTGHFRRTPGIVHACYQDSRLSSVGATNYAYWESRSENQHPPNRYIAISHALKERISPILPHDAAITVIHNGVDRVATVASKRFTDRAIDVAFVGRLTTEKGVRIALEVARAMPHRKFAFAGDGDLAGEVSAAADANPHIRLHSGMNHRGVASLMADSRIVMVPSQWDEPFGRVAAEAMAYGALPIVSALGGLPEVTLGLPYQAAIDARDVAAWKTSLADMLAEDASTLQVNSSACSESWRRSFSPEALANSLLRAYQDTIESGPVT